jgi:NAD(P)H-hydrate epimerase
VLENAAVPVVLDADALNIIAEESGMLHSTHAELILTPHLGEMARLCGVTISWIKEHLLESAREFARTHDLILVQKDARTITSIPHGMTYVNLSGNNGMSTGGSGDVLTGIIAGLIAQGAEPSLAAPLGVYIHGLAGDIGSAELGHYSLTAGSLLDALPKVFRNK